MGQAASKVTGNLTKVATKAGKNAVAPDGIFRSAAGAKANDVYSPTRGAGHDKVSQNNETGAEAGPPEMPPVRNCMHFKSFCAWLKSHQNRCRKQCRSMEKIVSGFIWHRSLFLLEHSAWFPVVVCRLIFHYHISHETFFFKT